MYINIKKELEFLFASRFIALVLGATTVYLRTKGWIGEAESNFIYTIAGGFITVKTVDKFALNMGNTTTTSTVTDTTGDGVSEVSTVSVTKPTEDSSVIKNESTANQTVNN